MSGLITRYFDLRRAKETGTFYFPWVNLVCLSVRVSNEGSLRPRVARAQGIARPFFLILLPYSY